MIRVYLIITKRLLLDGGSGGGGLLVYVALIRSSAIAHVKRMGISVRRQPTESGKRG